MTDAANAGPPPPDVDARAPEEIAAGIFVIRDRRVPLVPNIGIVLGEEAALVVDTGMGPVNGERVLEAARKLAAGRRLILTLSHFHPEHGFGAQAFKGQARITYNKAQRDELKAKGEAYLGMFRTFGPAVAAALEGTRLVDPDDVYEGADAAIDLGNRKVELRTWGQAHTRGDQVVWLPAERILFTGDLAEERIFPIFPWFPPNDADIDGARWAAILTELIELGAGDRRARSRRYRRCGDPCRGARLHGRSRRPRRRRRERPARMPMRSSPSSRPRFAPSTRTGRRRSGSTSPSATTRR